MGRSDEQLFRELPERGGEFFSEKKDLDVDELDEA
jgi:hypothetical protein